MTVEDLRDIAHAHDYRIAAFELERWRRRAGVEVVPADLRAELVRLYWVDRRWTHGDVESVFAAIAP